MQLLHIKLSLFAFLEWMALRFVDALLLFPLEGVLAPFDDALVGVRGASWWESGWISLV